MPVFKFILKDNSEEHICSQIGNIKHFFSIVKEINPEIEYDIGKSYIIEDLANWLLSYFFFGKR